MRTKTTQHLTLSALLCALLCVLSQILIPLPPVPASLALLAVHLCGALLGSRWGAAAVGCYVLLGAAGVPVYAGFSGGVSVLFGPTGGFLIGYIPCAFVSGLLSRRLGFSRRALMLAMTAGTLICCAMGMAWFSLTTGATLAASFGACVLPFIPGDAIKIIFAAALCLRLQKPLRSAGLCL